MSGTGIHTLWNVRPSQGHKTWFRIGRFYDIRTFALIKDTVVVKVDKAMNISDTRRLTSSCKDTKLISAVCCFMESQLCSVVDFTLTNQLQIAFIGKGSFTVFYWVDIVIKYPTATHFCFIFKCCTRVVISVRLYCTKIRQLLSICNSVAG